MSDAIQQLLIRYGPQLAPMAAFLIVLVCAPLTEIIRSVEVPRI